MKPSQQELGPARRDTDLTDDRQIQDNWIDSSHRCAHPILREPRLRDLIKLDPMTRVNPDKDVQPTGQFEIYNASETMSIYSPEGPFLGSVSTKRTETLAQAYRNELGDFPQAIAKLIARYKDGSKAGTHTVACKNCFTAPPSLTTALISALGATTELFATPFDFNPKKHYSALRWRVWCSPRCIFFHLAGQLLLSPRTLGCPNAEDLRWALACASIQTEPLLVTLLLPECPKSAFTSLLSHHSVLHLTTVHNISFLNPTSWTGQADHTRTFRSGTDVILVGNQKGYDTYYKADMSSAQLEIALRNLGAPNYRIKPRPRPCRQQPQQPQDHMTPTVPRALRRIQEAKEAILPILWRHSDQATNMSQAMPSQKLDAKSIWYTDGSKQLCDDRVNVMGAEVYNATRGISHSINPRGSGATNTITRAELAAIASALLLMAQGQDEIIATDSQASMCMIAKNMDSPQTLQQCKHKVMLEDIVTLLLARARKGLRTRILKGGSPISEFRETRRRIRWPQPPQSLANAFKNMQPVMRAYKASTGPYK